MDSALKTANAVDRARPATADWVRLPPGARVEQLRGLRLAAVDRLEPLLAAVQADTGKVRAEALMTDILPALEQMLCYERTAEQVLAPRRRPGSLLFPGAGASVQYRPFGVVLVIAPWNNPLQLSLLPAATALLAGNAVVVKPSERTPTVAAELRALFTAAGLAEPLVQVIEGGPDVAAGLVRARPDLVFFTGGAAGGRAVLRLAAEQCIPTIMELGGKDPMLVFADADLERAAAGAVYGAFAHDGQHCISVERLLVERPVCAEFARAVAAGAAGLSRGRDIAAELRPEAEVRALGRIAEALAGGARLLTPAPGGRPQLPAVLVDVPLDSALMREETFGPVLPVAAFDGEDEAVRLANSCSLGLGASVWTSDQVRARRVADRLECGAVCINNVLVNAGHPALPFGGVKGSGFGRYHGPEGLLAFVQPQAVCEQTGRAGRELNWFPYGPDLEGITTDLIRLRYGRSPGLLARLSDWLSLGRRRSARMRELARARAFGVPPVNSGQDGDSQ
ncbi:MAG TPA: aldehyde dehydrogenase family protein [Planctomycetota bacterium]|nr:aldehyde dehydrogenase family protein [Planctomycetota bacterium]